MMADPITKGEMVMADSGERFHSYISKMGIDLNRDYAISYDRPYDYKYLIIFQRDRTRILIEKFFKAVRKYESRMLVHEKRRRYR